MAVSFDLFGTLVAVDYPREPGAAVADELAARGVAVPDDWREAYRERHVDAPPGAEVPLPAHVSAALASRGTNAPENAPRRAVVAAFDPDVRTREGAVEAVRAAADHGPVGVLSNCSVPELARRALIRSAVDRDLFDAVVTSAGCGWRKPAPEAFEAVADGLGVAVSDLVHVGDDPQTDLGVERAATPAGSERTGTADAQERAATSDSQERAATTDTQERGATDPREPAGESATGVGGTAVLVDDVPLTEFPAWLAERR